ncbi:MAG TPA: methionyl-tRNA formyltransferase [Steroidobacteraceae bacterium]|jgi:methionyl-tRNA formyltransferase|nr:methionyl-tRNA formyltransferase [Steroidobacteraceae bacterium]
MRIAIVGQSDFGKAALEAFLDRGDAVAGVFCAPEKPGAAADPLRLAAEQRSIPVYQLKSLKTPEAHETLRGLGVDLGVMAYVLQFVPQTFATIPRHGMIQYHPSLLPRYRGPSSINWPIIRGDTRTGLTIFRPTDGLDEGPIILQKETPIGPDDTLGSVYFDRLFPMGIAALQEAADLAVSGAAAGNVQDEALASYEGWCREAEARINWHSHLDFIHNLIRGCDPAPAAWSTFRGKKLQFHAVRKHPARTFGQVKGHIGAVTAIGPQSICVAVQGGQIEVFKLRFDGGKKLSAPQVCAEAGLSVGNILGE